MSRDDGIDGLSGCMELISNISGLKTAKFHTCKSLWLRYTVPIWHL